VYFSPTINYKHTNRQNTKLQRGENHHTYHQSPLYYNCHKALLHKEGKMQKTPKMIKCANHKISKSVKMSKAENVKKVKINLRVAIKNTNTRFRPKNRVPWYPLELKNARTRRLGKHKLSKSAIYLTFWPFWGFVTFSLFDFAFLTFSLFWLFWFLHFVDFDTFLIFSILLFFMFCRFWWILINF